jgi:hypothetical protein
MGLFSLKIQTLLFPVSSTEDYEGGVINFGGSSVRQKVEPVQEHFHPPRLGHYLARASDVHYAMRPAQEGDVERR